MNLNTIGNQQVSGDWVGFVLGKVVKVYKERSISDLSGLFRYLVNEFSLLKPASDIDLKADLKGKNFAILFNGKVANDCTVKYEGKELPLGEVQKRVVKLVNQSPFEVYSFAEKLREMGKVDSAGPLYEDDFYNRRTILQEAKCGIYYETIFSAKLYFEQPEARREFVLMGCAEDQMSYQVTSRYEIENLYRQIIDGRVHYEA